MRTLPLVHGNYGGTLQAYALQRALREQGCYAITETPIGPGRSLREHVRVVKNLLLGRELAPERHPHILRRISCELSQFVQANINNTVKRSLNSKLPRRKFDVAIVGSDQVWRPAYTRGIERSFFEDVSPGSTTRLMSYAASFGKDSLEEFGASETESCSRLLGRFESVSVREASGAQLCSELGYLNARVVADPVFLLPAQHYLDLAHAPNPRYRSGARAFTLDSYADLDKHIRSLCSHHNLPFAGYFYPPKPTSAAEFRSDPARYALPSMSRWLREIATSELIVTDSFHVCAMSLILGTPFIALGNPARGQSRFESLLDTFGLRRLLTSSPETMCSIRLPSNDEFSDVSTAIHELRTAGIEFLREAIFEAPTSTAANRTILLDG